MVILVLFSFVLVGGFGAACACGEAVCAECKATAHWPLSCVQAKHQLQRMKANGKLNHCNSVAPVQIIEFITSYMLL